MNLSAVMTSGVKHIKYLAKKNQPEVMIISGIIGLVSAAVIACKETFKVDDILEEANEEIEAIEVESEKMTPQEVSKQKAVVRIKTAGKLVLNYIPSVAIGAASVYSILYGHGITKERELALSTALAGVTKKFSDYRERVAEKIGEDAELSLIHGIHPERIEEKVVDEETGKEKSKNVTKEVAGESLTTFNIWLDETNCSTWMDNFENFVAFLKLQQDTANNLIERDDVIALDDVFRWLGYKADKSERKVARNIGWKMGDFISFGLNETKRLANCYYGVNTPRTIQLCFNCRGGIWE